MAFLILPTAFFFSFSPILVNAAITSGPLFDLFTTLRTIFNGVIAVLVGLAFVVFLWGVYKYIYSASVEAKESARSMIIYGLIGLFVMLTAWGLVKILTTTFGFDAANTAAPVPGKIPKALRPGTGT